MYGGAKVNEEAVQQSLLSESDRMEEEQRQTHFRQRAFRVAFDFLEKHLPVQNTDEYWLKVCQDVSYASADNINNELCQELLSAVLEYMSNTAKGK